MRRFKKNVEGITVGENWRKRHNELMQIFGDLEILPLVRISRLNLTGHVNRMNSKVKWSRYRPGVAQRVGRGIALLFHYRYTRRGWVVSSTPRPHFTAGKDRVPIVQEGGWAPGQVWTGGKSRPHRDSIPDRPARSSVAKPTELPGPQNK